MVMCVFTIAVCNGDIELDYIPYESPDSIVYSGVDQRKHQSSASLAFVRGIPRTKGQ